MANSIVPFGKNRIRDNRNTDTFAVDLQAFEGYVTSEFQGFLVLTRYGVFYLYHYVNDGTQMAVIYPLYQTSTYSCSAEMSSDGKTVTLTFGRAMYGGITVFG